jgi:DNA-3-methyladenine glycosylase I
LAGPLDEIGARRDVGWVQMSSPTPPDGIEICEDGVRRCAWACSTPDYHGYHDTEWGFPVADDKRLFEKLSLEGFQAGLSWLTILRKRDAFRSGFADFDHQRVARFTEKDVQRLLADAGIVRHRGKIEAVINNAARAAELVESEGSIAHYVWSFEPLSHGRSVDELGRLPSTTPESVALSKDLKRRGWKFVGPTTVYAFMQAMGLVNDHREGCDAHPHATKARTDFQRP